jgi:hypothetical protein
MLGITMALWHRACKEHRMYEDLLIIMVVVCVFIGWLGIAQAMVIGAQKLKALYVEYTYNRTLKALIESKDYQEMYRDYRD